MAPADENECRQMLYTATLVNGPVAVRYPARSGSGRRGRIENDGAAGGQGATAASRSQRIAAVVFRHHAEPPRSLRAERLDATVVNMRFVKPLDEALLKELVPQHAAWVTLEENTIAGGAGSAVAELLDVLGLGRPHLAIGLPDRFIEHGSREQCLADAGLDDSTVVAAKSSAGGGLRPAT